MNGLLATHLLGLEFNRTVCLDTSFAPYLNAFRPIKAGVEEKCAQLLDALPPVKSPEDLITLLNFGSPSPPNECALQQKLASNRTCLWLKANTYPRWTAVPDQLFVSLYEPRQALLDLLPYSNSNPPQNVVHLRMGDNENDIRQGLENMTLHALGEMLPGDSYLVTNSIPWYQFFATNYGWLHPPWQRISHSALAISWGDASGEGVGTNLLRRQKHGAATEEEQARQNLQLWVDWYTLLRSKHIWHTQSDFSQSAIRWMNIQDSKVILGYDATATKQQVKLGTEAWRQSHATISAPLSQRRMDAVAETHRLLGCQG